MKTKEISADEQIIYHCEKCGVPMVDISMFTKCAECRFQDSKKEEEPYVW